MTAGNVEDVRPPLRRGLHDERSLFVLMKVAATLRLEVGVRAGRPTGTGTFAIPIGIT